MAASNISGCKICPAGFIEEMRDGKPDYKDFRKMPHVACVKKKAEEKAPEVVIKPPEQKAPEVVATPPEQKAPETIIKPPEQKTKSIVTLVDFGFESSRVRRGVKSAQAYMFLENVEEKKRESFRHYNISSILGKSEYGSLSDTTYEFVHGKEFKNTAGKKFRYPGIFRIKAEVRGEGSDSGGYSWFETDPLARNVYCQPHYNITVAKKDDGSYTLHESSCIAGNVRQIGFEEARQREMSVTGDFKEWMDIKSPDTKIDNKELIFDYIDQFNEKLKFTVT